MTTYLESNVAASAVNIQALLTYEGYSDGDVENKMSSNSPLGSTLSKVGTGSINRVAGIIANDAAHYVEGDGAYHQSTNLLSPKPTYASCWVKNLSNSKESVLLYINKSNEDSSELLIGLEVTSNGEISAGNHKTLTDFYSATYPAFVETWVEPDTIYLRINNTLKESKNFSGGLPSRKSNLTVGARDASFGRDDVGVTLDQVLVEQGPGLILPIRGDFLYNSGSGRTEAEIRNEFDLV
jgi:hypothetical protein